MQTVSPVIYDYGNREVIVHVKGKQVILGDQARSNSSFSVQVKNNRKWNTKEEVYFLVQLTGLGYLNKNEKVPSTIQELIKQFEGLFATPQGLPPIRTQDHHIPITAGSQPVN